MNTIVIPSWIKSNELHMAIIWKNSMIQLSKLSIFDFKSDHQNEGQWFRSRNGTTDYHFPIFYFTQ